MHPHEYEVIKAGHGQPITPERAQSFVLLNLDEAAKRLRISTRHLQRLIEIGEGPPRIRLGERRIAFPEDGLVAWVRQRTIPAKEAA